MTCWLLFPPLSQPNQPQQAPTSRKDSLVASPSTMQATPSTNKSLWLIGCFFHLSLNHTGYNKHQRAFMTHWYLFSPLLQPCRSQPAPTSHYDSLVPFFTSPLIMQATTSTNESLRLIGAFFLLSLNHADAHGILLYMENDYFCFSMHSSSLYSIFTNWLCECPRIHEYYTSSFRCHTTSWSEPVSLTLRTSLRLRQIKLNDSSSHEYCHVTSHMWSHALCEDVSVYAKPVVTTQLDTVKCSRQNSQSPTCEDEAEILTPHEVVFKHYALHSKQIP